MNEEPESFNSYVHHGSGTDKPWRPRSQHGWLRWLLIGLPVVVCLLALVFGAFQLWLRHAMKASLPQIDGNIRIAGLAGPVTVRRDKHGVPHIQAQTVDDLFFAQGYVTAQDRLWQMDILRRDAAGELSEIFGAKALPHDREQRVLQMRYTADAAATHLDADQTRMLQDYANGVNAYIDTHTGAKGSGELPAEFRLLRYTPAHWQVRDTLLMVLIMAQDLTTEYPTKLARELVMRKLPPELAGDLYPVGSWRDHPPGEPVTDLTLPQKEIPDVPLDESQSRNDLPHIGYKTNSDKDYGVGDKDYIAALRDLRSDAEKRCDGCRAGSNNWVVSGSHTAGKLPLLSNDMHLGFSIPSIWYMADLEAPGYHATGVTLPGSPFIVVGHNESIAWGFTNLGADVQDLYIEQPNAQGETSITDANGAVSWKPIEHRREVIHIRGHSDEVLDVSVTAHGPVLTPLLPHEKRMISLRWIVYEPGAVSVPFFAINTAQSWQQFCTAFAKYAVPSQNAVYADKFGHIGYHAVGWVPNRPSGLNGTPITGGQGEWQGMIPFEAMPQVYDPPEGVLATANARVTQENDPHPLTLDWEAPYRNERVWKRLLGRDGLRREDMLALEDDIYSDLDHELAQRFAYAIDHTAKTSAHLRQAADILRNWNGEMTTDSPAPAIVAAARTALWPLVLKPRLGDDWQAYLWSEKSYVQEEMVVHQPARWLPSQYATWNALLTAAVQAGLSDSHAPSNLNNWHWGSVHRVQIQHPLYSLVPLMHAMTGIKSQPISGDVLTVKSIGVTFGPSERFTADMSDLDGSTLNLVVGESGNPYSPFYRDQWDFWYNGTTFALPFTNAAVAAATTHTLTLTPTGAAH